MSTGCKIGRVRLKGGADLAVFPVKPISHDAKTMIEYTRQISDNIGPELSGFLVIGWDTAGGYSCGFHCPDESAIPVTLLPSWTADVVRRRLGMS